MKLKTKIIAIIVAVLVVAGIVTLSVTLGKNCGGSSETVSASEQASESFAGSESKSDSAKSSETAPETDKDSAEHTHSGGEATCTKKAVCEVCGEEYGETKAHDFSAKTADEKYLAKAATCEKAAEYYLSCSVCGEKGDKTFESGEALGHKLSEKFVSLGNGKHAKKCEREDCSYVEDEADCKGGEATCAKKAVCEVCGGEYGETKAHEFAQTPDNKYLVSAASCTSSAVYVKSCKVCGTKGTETFAFGSARGHDYSSSKYISDGKGGHYKSCSRCGTKTSATACSGGEATCKELAVCSVCGGKYGTLVAHSYTKEVADSKYLASKATCESPAKYYKLCEYCGEKGNETFESAEEKDKALGHEMSEGVVSLGDDTHAKKCMRSGCDYIEGEPEACSGGTATCTERAVCDACKTEYGAEPSHSWNDGEDVTLVTCLVDGVKKYTCTVEGCTATKTETIKCVGHHTYAEEKTCTNDRECSECHEIDKAKGHVYETISETAATCTESATKTQKCSVCNDERTITEGEPLGHTPVLEPEYNVLQDGKESCYYIRGYKCSVCEENITKDKNETFEQHQCTSSIITPATCMVAGKKKLTCTKCGFETTEAIEIDTVNGHNWDEGTLVDGTNKKEFKCQNDGCEASKIVVVVASVEGTGTVSAGDVKENGEVHLDGASMDLSDIKDQLPNDGEVTIGAKTLTEEEKNKLLSAADKETIGENEVYDFTLKNGEEDIGFGKKTVKIVLPYDLIKPGEDVDSIAIWYIDKEGKTTNVKAYYYKVGDKGYVTFEAEHFSYYTVTRLTPEERCKLYGHSERKYPIAKTCTDDGYTLYVCLRCGEERKEDIITAEGHTYDENRTEATCVADGKIVHKCSVCNYSYEEIIVAAGHQWNVTETEATCETAGYTEKTCTKCGDSFKENYVQALGHNYKASFSWSEDNSSATLCIICENDSKHNVEIAAVVTSVETKATCSSPAKTAYTAKAEFNGELYVEKKDVVTGEETLEHKFGEGYSYDDESHYRECILCGSKEDKADHELSDGEIIKSATCSAYGEKVYVCETCGYVKKEIIPATGEHYYINGACAYCGAEYTACDHTVLTPKLLTGEDLGICKGTQIVVMTCACGEVKKWFAEGAIACEIEQLTDSGETEDGNDYYKLVDTCKICGAVYDLYDEDIETNCSRKMKGYLKITKNGVVKLNAELDITSYYWHRIIEPQDINVSDLTDETVCGGYITVGKCPDCGYIKNWDFSGIACKNISDKEPTEFDYIDKDGTRHYGMYIVCDDCGLKLVGEEISVALSSCLAYVKNVWQIIANEKVIYEYVRYEDFSADHETERTFEKIGETCVDGVKVTTTCKNCDLVNTYISYNHQTEFEEINLPEGACGGSIDVRRCVVCKEIIEVWNISGYHSFRYTETKYTDDNNREHTVTTGSCLQCKYEYVTDEYRVLRGDNPCEWTVYTTKTISYDGEVICSTNETSYTDTHDYERTARLKEGAASCEDGIIITATCKICNESHEWERSGHNYEWVYIELPEGSCSDIVEVCRCIACNEIVRINYVWDGDHSFSYTEKTYTDDNNREHTVTTRSCSRCGLEYVTDEYRVLRGENPCEWIIYRSKTISFNGEVICSVNETSYTDTHEYERTAKLKEGASSCDDGIIITETCKICNESHEWERSGHYYEWTDIELPEGSCNETLEVYRCIACGDTTNCNIWNDNHQYETKVDETYTGDDGYEHRRYLKKCTKCGFEYGYDEYEVPSSDNQCEYTLYRITTYKISDWSKSFEERYDRDSHIYIYNKFELDGVNCDDGWTAYGECAICGKKTSESGIGHYSDLTVEYYDLAKKGACEGTYIRKYKCACGFYEGIDYNFCDGVNRETVDIQLGDGEYSHTRTTYTCSKCNLKVEIEKIGVKEINTEKHTCDIVYTKNWNIAVCGTGIANISVKSVDTYNHNFERKYTLKEGSSTCDDGVIVNIVCLDCGYTDNYGSSGHSYNIVESHELNSVCGGTAYYMECPCGYRKTVEYSCKCDFDHNGHYGNIEGGIEYGSYSYFDEYYNSDNFYLGNHYYTFENYWSIDKCAVTDPAKCGYVIRYSRYWVKTNDCTATKYERWQFGYKDDGSCDWEKIIDTEEVRVYHEFKREEINENGVSGYKLTCACGSYYTYREFYAENGYTVRIEVESENLAENGGIKKHTHTINVTNRGRDLGFVTCTYTDADGEEHTSTCEKTAYDAGSGFTNGVRSVYKSENYYREYIYADIVLKNWQSGNYTLYDKRIENKGTDKEYWREWTYTYDFDACIRTCVYKNSTGDESTDKQSHFYVTSSRTEKEPTCTQPGERVSYCVNCEEILNRYEIEPDHAWAKVGDDRYVCVVCGLENTNGASGKIVMEDLTDYKNGEDYVVGYYFREGDISSYVLSVSLVRKTASGNEYDEIYLDMTDFVITTDGTVSVRFSKAIVEQLALAKLGELSLNREDYNIRFSFVPKGFKDELDYAITFENVDYSAPTETDGNAEYIIRTEDLKNGVEFSFTPTENCSLAILAPELYIHTPNFWSSIWYDFSSIILEGENETDKTSNICDGQRDGYQYIYAYKLEENKTYKITLKLDAIEYSFVKFIPVVFNLIPSDSEEYKHVVNGKRMDVGRDVVYEFDTLEDLRMASEIMLFDNEPNPLVCGGEFYAHFKCDGCGKDMLITVKVNQWHVFYEYLTSEPTCEEEGTKIVRCKCGENSEEVVAPALGHDLEYRLEDENETIVHVFCSRCGYAYDLTFDEKPAYEIIEEAKCDQKGIGQFVGYIDGKKTVIRNEIAELPHMTESGNKYYPLSLVLYTDDINIRLFADQAPTCGGEPAMGAFRCAVCGKDVLVKVTAPHVRPDKIEDGNYKAPTCVTPGWIRYNCTVCDTADVYEVLEPWGHDYKAEVIDKADSDDGKYHLVYVCQRERLNDEGDLAPCAEEDCRIDYVSDEPIIVEVTEAATCCDCGEIRYTIFYEDGSAETFSELIYNTGIHNFNGTEIDANVVIVFANVEEFKNSGLTLWDDSEEISCWNEVAAYFQCENSNRMIIVYVRFAHTIGESTNVDITDDGHRHYTCDVCGYYIDEIIENRESAN